MAKSKTLVVTFSSLIVVLLLIATLPGLVDSTGGEAFEFTTVRGNTVTIQGHGVYKYDPQFLVVEAIAWDAVNLIVGLPCLLLSIYLFNKDSMRGRLLLSGLLFYFFYVYLMYATMVAYNRLFLAYILIYALSLASLLLVLRHIPVDQLPQLVSQRFPRKAFSIYAFAFAGALLFLWLGRIVPSISGETLPAGLEGLTTLETQALDLGIIVPLMLASGLLLWKNTAWGYYLTSIGVTAGFMMFIAIPAMVVAASLGGGYVQIAEVAVMSVFILLGMVFVVLFYRNIIGSKS